METVAVVGSGIAGMTAAFLLSRRYRVHLFERETRLGGHTCTVHVAAPSGSLALDAGFLVYNDATYPNLVRLFAELGVGHRPSDMSFAVRCRRTGLEYSSRGLNGFFAQRRNLVAPAHAQLLADIVRFNRAARRLLAAPDLAITLGEFLAEHRFGSRLEDCYVLPMTSAIWSASRDAIRAFPAFSMARFLDNHGLLQLRGQPQWRVVANGSQSYIGKITAPLGARIGLNSEVVQVQRCPHDVRLLFRDREPQRFDHVVLACHGDQVLPLLGQPTARERAVFSTFTTTANDAVVHTDASVLPVRAAARASWNYLLGEDPSAPPSVTYDLNRLQGLHAREQYCVTLNPVAPIAASRILARFAFRHPVYTAAAMRAQAAWRDVSGGARTHYCGAYWGYGFHEDGVTSALRVATAMGVTW